MRYLDGFELEEAIKFMNFAVEEARKSPCEKVKRGVILFKENKIIGKGHNSPPFGFFCEPTYCLSICSTYAIHAEMNAIIDAVKNGYDINASRLYHAKTENGELQDSRKPKCPDCSKHILEFGIDEIVLKHKEGYALYNAKEFHELSLRSLSKE